MFGEHTSRFWFELSGELSSSERVHEAWVEVAESCSGALCAFTPDIVLLNGDYVYRVTQWSQELGGPGALSNLGRFIVLQDDSLLQPAGVTTAGTTLTFRWREVLDMTHYAVAVIDSGDQTVFEELVPAELDGAPICVDGVCEWAAEEIALDAGDYTWTLRPRYLDPEDAEQVVDWVESKTAAEQAEMLPKLQAAFRLNSAGSYLLWTN
jgi:hypothetical protein